jgi:hypothetical protein
MLYSKGKYRAHIFSQSGACVSFGGKLPALFINGCRQNKPSYSPSLEPIFLLFFGG